MAPKRSTRATENNDNTADGPLPTTSAELARVIAQAIAQHEENRADSSGRSLGPRRRETETGNLDAFLKASSQLK